MSKAILKRLPKHPILFTIEAGRSFEFLAETFGKHEFSNFSVYPAVLFLTQINNFITPKILLYGLFFH